MSRYPIQPKAIDQQHVAVLRHVTDGILERHHIEGHGIPHIVDFTAGDIGIIALPEGYQGYNTLSGVDVGEDYGRRWIFTQADSRNMYGTVYDHGGFQPWSHETGAISRRLTAAVVSAIGDLGTSHAINYSIFQKHITLSLSMGQGFTGTFAIAPPEDIPA